MTFIWSVIVVLFIQRFEFVNTDDFGCKLLLVITATCSIVKTFFFMRIFKGISYLVTMIFQVFLDLMPFLLFYLILIVFFSLYFGILGLGNYNVEGTYRDSVKEAYIKGGNTWTEGYKFEAPGVFLDGYAPLMGEYLYMPKFFAYWFSTFNVSLGNFDFDPPSNLSTKSENIMYWVLWTITLVTTNIIFLNFIIAEASESYAKVKETLEESKSMEKADMINESESMLPTSFINRERFPRYIISRTVLS